MNLLLIDSRLDDVQSIVSSLNETCKYIVFSHETDSFDSLKEKILALDVDTIAKYECIGIAQLNYSAPVFDFLQNRGDDIVNLVKNVEIQDGSLNTWNEFTHFCTWLVEEKNCSFIDLLACNLWSDANWVYIINTLRTQSGIYIRASIDITGIGGNFILESDGVDTIGIYFTDAILAYKYSFDFTPYYQTWYSGKEAFISAGSGGTFNYTKYSTFTGTYPGNAYIGSDITTNITGLRNHHVIGGSSMQAVVYHKLNGTIITGGAYLLGGNASRDATLSPKLVNITKVVPCGIGFFVIKSNGNGILVWGQNIATANASFKEITTYNFVDAIGNSGAILGITSTGAAIFINTTVTTDLTSTVGTGIKSYVFGTTCFGMIKADDSAVLYDNAGTTTSITGVTVTKIYTNGTGATALLLCNDNTIRNVSKTVLITLNPDVAIRRFIPFYSNNWAMLYTDMSGTFSISNVRTTVQGMTDFAANTYSYAYIKDGSVVLGGSLSFITGTHGVPARYSITDGNAVKIWSTNNTTFAVLKSDRTMVAWGSDLTFNNTPAQWKFTDIGVEIMACSNIQNIGLSCFTFIQNNMIYSLGYFRHTGKTLQSITKTENKNVDIQTADIQSIVEYDAYTTISPSSITYGQSTTLTYETNDINQITDPYNVYALCSGSTIVSTFTPTTATTTYVFPNVVLTGEYAGCLAIYDITTTKSLALSLKIAEIKPTIIQPPAEPVITRIDYSSETAVVYFTVAGNGGSEITKYQYSINDGALTDAVGTSSPITITGLNNGEQIRIKLVAVNAIGTSYARPAIVNGSFDFYLSTLSPALTTNTYIPNWNYSVTGTTTNSVQVAGSTYNGISVPAGYTKQCVLVNNQTGAGIGTQTLTQYILHEKLGMKKLQFQMAHVPFVDQTSGYLQVQHNGTTIGNIQLTSSEIGITNLPTMQYTPYTMYFDTKTPPTNILTTDIVKGTIPGIQLWLDAQDTSTLNLTGSSLNSWADTSALERLAIKNGTFATNAQYSSTSLNGLPGITFTNTGTTNNGLRVPVPQGTFLKGASIFVVFSRNSTASTNETLVTRTLMGQNGTSRFTFNGGYTRTQTSNLNFNRPEIMGVYSLIYNPIQSTSTQITEYFNGVTTMISSTDNFNDNNATATNLFIGCYSYTTTTYGLNGTIGQVIVFDNPLTDVQRETVEIYLMQKWNMQNSMVDARPYSKLYPSIPNLSVGELKFIYSAGRNGALSTSSTSTLHLTGITIEEDSYDWIVPRDKTQAPQVSTIDVSNGLAIMNLSEVVGIYPQKYQYSIDGINYTDIVYDDTTFNGLTMVNGASINVDYTVPKPNLTYNLKMVATQSKSTTQYATLPSMNKSTSGFSANFWMWSNSSVCPVRSIFPVVNSNFDMSFIDTNTWASYSAQLSTSPVTGWSFDSSNSSATVILSNGENAYADYISPPARTTQVVGLRTGGACYGITMKQSIDLSAGIYTFSFYVKSKTALYNAQHGISVSLIGNDGNIAGVSPVYTDIVNTSYTQIKVTFFVPTDTIYVLSFITTNPALVDSVIYIADCEFTYVPQANLTPLLSINSAVTYNQYSSGIQLYMYNGLLYSTISNGSKQVSKLLSYVGVNDSTWYHVSLNIASDGTQTTYINGLLKTQYTGQPTLSATNYVSNYLGMSLNSNGLYNFNGYMDDVRIYDRVLTNTEVLSINNYVNQTLFALNNDASLLGRWKFNYTPYTNKVLVPLKSGNSYNVRIRTNDTPYVSIQNYDFSTPKLPLNTESGIVIPPIGWFFDLSSVTPQLSLMNGQKYNLIWNPFIGTDQALVITHNSIKTHIVYQYVWLDVGTYTFSYYYGGSTNPSATATINVTLDGVGAQTAYTVSSTWYYVKFNVSVASAGFKKLIIRTESFNSTLFICEFTNFRIVANSSSLATISFPITPLVDVAIPIITSSAATDGGAIIYLTQPQTAGTTISGYKYSINGGAQLLNAVGTTSPITITGLTNLTEYSIQIYAVNDLGIISKPSPAFKTIPYKEMLPVNVSSMDFSQNNLIVNYSTLPYPDNTANTHFIYSADGASTISQINTESYKIIGSTTNIVYDAGDKKVGSSSLLYRGGYLSVPAFTSSANGISISCWVKMTATSQIPGEIIPTDYKVVDFGNNISGINGGFNNISLFTKYNSLYNPAIRVYTSNGVVYNATWTTTTFNLDTWYHIVAVFNTINTVSLYVDGVSLGDQYLPYPESTFRNINYIGASTSVSETYNYYGKMNDFRFYNGKMLNSNEISTLMNYDGTNTQSFALNNSSELLYYYTFNQQPQSTSFIIPGLTKNVSANVIPYTVLDIPSNIPIQNGNFDASYIEPYTAMRIGATDIIGWTIDTTYNPTMTNYYLGRGYYNLALGITTSPPITNDYYLAFQSSTGGTALCKFYKYMYLPIGYITISCYASVTAQQLYLSIDECAPYTALTSIRVWGLYTFSFYNYSATIHKISLYTGAVGAGAGALSIFTTFTASVSPMQYRIPQKIMHYSFNTDDLSGSFIQNKVTGTYDASLNGGAVLSTTIKKYDTASVALALTNRFVNLPSFTMPTPGKGSGFTIAFWYYGVSNPTGTANIISLKSAASPTNEIQIRYASTAILTMNVYNDAGAVTFLNANIGFTPSVWMHIAFTIQYNSTMNDATYSMYINGIVKTSSSPVNYYPKLINRDNNVIINPGNINFNIDDFKLFNDCLNADEIRELYITQNPIYENQSYKSYISSRQLITTGAPDSPTLISLVPTSAGELTAYFTPPANNGGSTITGYKYSIGINSTQLYDASGTTSPIVLLNVPSNKTLEICIHAVNEYGASHKSKLLSTMAFGFDNTPLIYYSPTATSIDVSFQETVATGYQPMQYKYTFNGTTVDFSNQSIDVLSYNGKCNLMNRAWTYDAFVHGTNGNVSMVTSGAGTNATTVTLTIPANGYIKVGWVLFIDGASSSAVISAVSNVGTTFTVTLATPITWVTAKSAVAYPSGDNQMYINVTNGSIGAGWKYRTTSGVYTVSSTTAATGLARITFVETITGLNPNVDILTGRFTPPSPISSLKSYLSIYSNNVSNTNAHVTFENLKYEQTGMTIAFWMWGNVPTTSTNAYLITMNNNFGLYMNGNTGIITTALGNLGTTNISTTVSANTKSWVHVAFTITSANAITIYLNGTSNVTGTIAAYPAYNIDTSPTCVIGAGLLGSNTDGFTGYISDFRIYNGKALTLTEIQSLVAYQGEENFALDTDLTLTTRFKFDLSSNEFMEPRRDYSLLNGVKYDTTNVLYGQSSFRFDSSASALVSPQIHTSTFIHPRIANRRGFSMALWVKPNISLNSGYTASTLITSNIPALLCFDMVLASYNTIRIHIGNGGNAGATITFSVNINNNTWNHVAFIYTHTGFGHLYVNGNFVGVGSYGVEINGEPGWPIIIGGSVANVGNTTIANMNNTTNPFNGNMDDIRIYSGYVLTKEEIQTLYSYRGEDINHYLNTHPSLQIWCKSSQTMTTQQLQLIDSAYIPAAGAFITTIDKVVGTASMRIPAGGIVKMPAIAISSTTGISIAFWAQFLSYGSNTYIMDYRSLPATANEFSIMANANNNGSIGMYMNGTLYSGFASGTINLNRWYHIAFTISSAGSTILYINGNAVSTVSTGYPTIKGKTVNYLSPTSSATFNGYIDDLRIYNGKILTAGEIASIYTYRGESGFTLNSDPTLYYLSFEPYEDKHIQGLHTTVTPSFSTPLKINQVQYSTDSVVNKYSAYFPYGQSGKASYVSFPGIALRPHGFSVSSWVKQPEQRANTTLFQMQTNGMNINLCSYYIYLSNASSNKIATANTLLNSGTGGITNTFSSNFMINYNEWCHLAIVVNGMNQTISVYINGVLAQTQANMTYINYVPFYASAVTLGNNSSSDGYTGYVDDFRFYNGKILTANEIAQLYAYRGELDFALDSDPALIIQYPKETYSSAKTARNQLSGLTTGTNYPYTLSATLPLKNLIQNGNFDMDGLQSGLSTVYTPPTSWSMTTDINAGQSPRLSGNSGLTGIGFPTIPYPYIQCLFIDTATNVVSPTTSLHQNIYLTPDTYTFSFFAAARSIGMNILLYSQISSVATSSNYQLTNLGWNKYSFTFTITTAGTYPVKIGFAQGLGASVQCGIAITGVSLSKTTVATRTLDVIPYTNPNPPTITSLTPGNSQITVNITQGYTGGLPIQKYSYSLDNGSTFQDFASLNPLVISGLTNGQTYPVILKAYNGRLESTNSNKRSEIPFTKPETPIITSLTPGNARLVLTITQGATGGFSIQKYSYSLDNGITFQDFSGLDPLFIDGLTNGQPYQVLIKGNNGKLDSSNSNVMSETPFTNPAAPTITSIVPGIGELTVNFTQGSTGGFPIETYKYSLDNGSTFQDISGLISPIIIKELTNGQTYPVILKAYNGKLESTLSNKISGKPFTYPDAPIITNVVPDDQRLTVYYTNGAFNGGTAIVKNSYSIDDGATFQDIGITSPFIISNLTNGQTYTVLLRANNTLDSSNSMPYSQEVFIRPIPPTINSVVNGNGTIDVYFTPSGETGSLTKYRYSINGGSTFTDLSLSTTSPFTISGLTNGISYQIVMRATSNFDSNNSNVVTATPYAYPDPPTITSIVGAPGGILFIHFTLGSDNGSPITMMSFSINAGITYYAVSNKTSPLRISGLNIGQEYDIRLKSHNVNGISNASNMMSGIPAGPPGAPSIFSIVNGMNMSTIRITPGAANGTPILGYQVSLDDGVTYSDISYNPVNSSIVLNGLTNGILTEVYIRAVNVVGVSPKITTFVKAIDLRPPSAPVITSVSLTEEGLATIAYQLVDDTPIIQYFITALSSYGNMTFRISQANPIKLYNLYKGYSYKFNVTIKNTYGTATSEDSSSVIIATKPSSFNIRRIIPNYDVNTTLVHISYPYDGGSPILKYQYSINSGQYTDISGLIAPFHIHDLSENVSLDLRIKAINLYGEVISSPKSFMVQTDVPSQIGVIQTIMSYKQMSVKFLPISNNGATITSYSYLLYTNDVSAASYVQIPPVMPFTITDLDLNTSYSIQVIATNRIGSSIPSARTKNKLYQAYAPSAPVIYQLLQSPGQIEVYTLSSAPSTVETTNYLYSLNGQPFIQTSDDSNPFTITGLENNQQYSITVKAMNEVGISAASKSYTFTIFYDVPRRPSLYNSYIKLSDGFTFSFSEAYDNGSLVTGYKYRLNGGDWIVADVVEKSITVTGLSAGSYVVELLATNAIGDGSISKPRLYRTLGV